MAGILGIFGPTKSRLKNFGENFGAFFVGDFVARKKIFRANSICSPDSDDCLTLAGGAFFKLGSVRLQTCPSLHLLPRVGPRLGCLPQRSADLGRSVPLSVGSQKGGFPSRVCKIRLCIKQGNKGLDNRQKNEVELHPLSVPPPETLQSSFFSQKVTG